MKTTSAHPVVVESGRSGVVTHIGPHGLCSFADRLEFGDALSSRIAIVRILDGWPTAQALLFAYERIALLT